MERHNCLMILFSMILGGYLIILGAAVFIFGDFFIIWGAQFIIFSSNTIIFGAYFVIFGAFFIIFGAYLVLCFLRYIRWFLHYIRCLLCLVLSSVYSVLFWFGAFLISLLCRLSFGPSRNLSFPTNVCWNERRLPFAFVSNKPISVHLLCYQQQQQRQQFIRYFQKVTWHYLS